MSALQSAIEQDTIEEPISCEDNTISIEELEERARIAEAVLWGFTGSDIIPPVEEMPRVTKKMIADAVSTNLEWLQAIQLASFESLTGQEGHPPNLEVENEILFLMVCLYEANQSSTLRRKKTRKTSSLDKYMQEGLLKAQREVVRLNGVGEGVWNDILVKTSLDLGLGRAEYQQHCKKSADNLNQRARQVIRFYYQKVRVG